MCKGKKLVLLVGLMLPLCHGFCQAQKKEAAARAGKMKTETVNAPAAKLNATASQAGVALAAEAKALLGKYELYAGIPSTYLGHIVLMTGGKYKVAFSTDETDYETGNYIYHPDTNSIEWLSGLAKRKDWNGKLIKKSGGYRIEFTKTTFAEN
jgi:hypothetical protein